MKRASTSSETKRSGTNNGLSASQRLAAAGSDAIEAHARVRWLADCLSEELETAETESVPSAIDPEDSMVVAVEKAANTMAAVSASMAAVSTSPPPPPFMPSTNLGVGVGPVPVRPARTKLGIGTGSRHKSETDKTDKTDKAETDDK